MSNQQMFNGLPWYPTQQPLPPNHTCSHCGQVVVTYRRTFAAFHRSFMRELAKLNRPVSKREMKLGYTARNTGHLAGRWGLVATQSQTGRGAWVLTPAGTQFLLGTLEIPPHCVGSGTSVAWYEGEPINIDTPLGAPDEYEEYQNQKTGG